MMAVTMAYFLFDLLYIIWIYSFQRKMPSYLNSWLFDSVVGDTEKLKREIYQYFDEGVQEMFPRAIEELRAEKQDRIVAEKAAEE